MKTNPAKSVAFDSQDALHKLGERKAIQHQDDRTTGIGLKYENNESNCISWSE